MAPVSFPHMVLRNETRSLYYFTAPKNTDETQIIMTVLPTHYFWFHFCWLGTFTLPLALFGERCKLKCNGQSKTVTSRITGRQLLQFAHQCGAWLFPERICCVNTYRPDMGPVPAAARPKAWVCGRSLAGIAGSNPPGGMDVCLLWVLWSQ